MRPSFHSIVHLALAVAASTTTATEEEGTCRGTTQTDGVCTPPSPPIVVANPQQPAECGLYMAPSTLGEGANLGMYAGTNIAKGVDIQQEIAIPLLFRDWEGPSFFHQYPNVVEGDHDDGALWFRYV